MIATIAYFLFFILILLEIITFFKKIPLIIIQSLLLLISLLLIVEIINRSIQIQFTALTNTFEALVFFTAFINLTLLLFSFWKKNNLAHAILFIGTLIAFIMLSIASSPLVPDTVKPPIPALQSAWLILHVALAFVGESFFAFSFAASIFYLLTNDPDKKQNADKLITTTIGIGYPIFTIGALIFGAIWAQYAWGRFWSWDPKETFALITWLVYTIYLHLRLMTKVSVKVTVWVAILGFLFTLFTFFGVNYLLPSLHSYR
ncbi:MAG: cytochrome c biogenesis protein CcsA [Spirochaetes bacterium]|nr:cytochrome c biogenesis protein CcsA [Spirochaetota bacterium]